MGTADVIHLACHGEFTDRQPLESGLLLAGDDHNDGNLHVHEVFGLDLTNVNLVTLSSCETIYSRIENGRDVTAFTRGLLYAGTPSVLATLWKLENQATLHLVQYFYENWHQKGMSKPEALRQAQIALKAEPRFQHPYYWGAFVLIGDWL